MAHINSLYAWSAHTHVYWVDSYFDLLGNLTPYSLTTGHELLLQYWGLQDVLT